MDVSLEGSGDLGSDKGNKIGIAAILISFAIVFIVLVAGIALVITSSDKKGGSSPESAFQDMISGFNSGDFRKVYGASILSLNMTFAMFKAEVGNFFDADFDIVVKEVTVIGQNEMTQDQKDDLGILIDQLEDALGMQVDDFCIINYAMNITTTRDGETESQDVEDTMACVMIDSRWYLVFPVFDEGDGGDVPPTVVLERSSITNGQKITILSVSRSDIEWGQVSIRLNSSAWYLIWNPTTAGLSGVSAMTYNCSDQGVNGLLIGCNVTDLAGNGMMNSGDFVTLFTYDGMPTFSPGTDYTVTLVYPFTSWEMGKIQFTG